MIFENRNLYDGLSQGIWTIVDDVRVVDAGPFPAGSYSAYLPLMTAGYLTSPCDPAEYGVQARP